VAEPSLILLLLVLAGLGFHFLRGPDVGPGVIWTLAWVSVFATGILLWLSGGSGWMMLAGYVLGGFSPVLVLIGALVYAGVRPAPWLLPGGLLFGLARAALAGNGAAPIAQTLSLFVEPSLLLAAAWVALGPARAPAASLAQRLLPATFVLLGVVEGANAASWILHGAGATAVGIGWFVVGPPTLVLQIQALGERSRAELRRARDDLERRVEERTGQLRESEERFRRLVAVSSEGIVIHERGAIREVNPALAFLFGYRHSELIGSQLVGLLVPADRERIGERISGGFEGASQATALRKDGSTFPVELEAREVVHEGRVLCACGVRDISERRRAEEERRSLERHMRAVQKLESLGVLAGGIAHDFNNLLAVILGNCRVALDDLPGDSPVRKMIGRVQAAGEQASGLVEQLLTYSGKRSPSQMPLDLSRLVMEMLDLLRVSVSEKCSLVPELEADLPAVDGDPYQIRQVVLNLVTNASEAIAGSGGNVTVRTGTAVADAAELAASFGATDLAPGRYVFVEVSDTGTGITAETRARVFEPFFTTKFFGRGLGLASVLGIVRAHGGAIAIESEPGHGSRFRVLLPPSPRVGRSEPLVDRSVAGPCEGALVLVVDDEEPVLEVAQHFLERAGFAVLTALGGEQAVDLFRARAEEIDAVVLDLTMPDKDGLETCLEIGRIRSGVPVIVTSGFGEEFSNRRLEGQAIAGFLRKPFEPEDLVSRILEVTRRGPASGDVGIG
jgi:PAS domain S-box-containing protein